jgi:hypothetical protein
VNNDTGQKRPIMAWFTFVALAAVAIAELAWVGISIPALRMAARQSPSIQLPAGAP